MTEHFATGPDYSTFGRGLPAQVRRVLLEIVERDDDVAVGAAHWLLAGDEAGARGWLDRMAPGWEGWS